MPAGLDMEVIFLIAGLAMIAVGTAIIVSEMRDRRDTRAVTGRVVGFSSGKHNRPTSPSFHSVAQYVGLDGHTYYVEGAIGSSEPLHAVGDAVTVLVRPAEPEKALLKSSLSFILGVVLALMGLAFVAAFRYSFRANLFSLVMAAFVLGGLAFKIRKSWRKQRLSWEEWRAYKKQIFAPRVFTNDTKDQIRWSDPTTITVAIQRYKKSRRFALPVLLVIGLTGLAVGYHFQVKTEAFLAIADRASGRVIDLRETDPTSTDGTTYAAVVEFRVNEGKTLTFKDSLSASPPMYDVGEDVFVLFDPSNPSSATIDRGRANYWVSIALYGLGALFLLMAWSARKRRLEN
jgi:hypothetical protein